MNGNGNSKSEARRTYCKLLTVRILVFGDRRMSSECTVLVKHLNVIGCDACLILSSERDTQKGQGWHAMIRKFYLSEFR
jgi:hypothetical protein